MSSGQIEGQQGHGDQRAVLSGSQGAALQGEHRSAGMPLLESNPQSSRLSVEFVQRKRTSRFKGHRVSAAFPIGNPRSSTCTACDDCIIIIAGRPAGLKALVSELCQHPACPALCAGLPAPYAPAGVLPASRPETLQQVRTKLGPRR